MMLCSLVLQCQLLRGTCCLDLHGSPARKSALETEAASPGSGL